MQVEEQKRQRDGQQWGADEQQSFEDKVTARSVTYTSYFL